MTREHEESPVSAYELENSGMDTREARAAYECVPKLLEALQDVSEQLAFMLSKYEPTTTSSEDYSNQSPELSRARAAIAFAKEHGL